MKANKQDKPVRQYRVIMKHGHCHVVYAPSVAAARNAFGGTSKVARVIAIEEK